MSENVNAPAEMMGAVSAKRNQVDWEWWASLYLRLTLGAAFLSAVADRFGLWGKYGGWGNFATFTKYVGQVNSFVPAATIPFLAWAATVAETSLGILLIVGLWPRWVALGSAILLAMFGTAMAISFGIKSPLDYSVFSASAGAFLLAVYANQTQGTKGAGSTTHG